MPDPEMTRLLDLLAEERAAIIEGRYAALSAIGAAKIGAVRAAYARPRAGSGQARGIAAMRHNQALLAAAIGGLRGATAQANRSGTFLAYGKDGSRAAIGQGQGGFERRA